MTLARKLTSRGICIQEIGASYEPILVTKSQIKSPASEGGENLQYTETSVRNRNVGPEMQPKYPPKRIDSITFYKCIDI